MSGTLLTILRRDLRKRPKRDLRLIAEGEALCGILLLFACVFFCFFFLLGVAFVAVVFFVSATAACK